MAAETLLREVEDKRKKALDSLDADYAGKIQEAKNRAQSEKQRIQENARKLAAESTQRETVRILGAAKLQAKKLTFDATETMLENNLAALRNTLSVWVGSKDYENILPKMAKYASRRLGGDIAVICRQQDAAILSKAGVEIQASNLKSIGGFKAEKKDGTLELDLTFEELLRYHGDDIRAAILSGD